MDAKMSGCAVLQEPGGGTQVEETDKPGAYKSSGGCKRVSVTPKPLNLKPSLPEARRPKPYGNKALRLTSSGFEPGTVPSLTQTTPCYQKAKELVVMFCNCFGRR